ncbi:MAG: glycosyltransferase [Chloroflexota bacterium]
MGHTTSPHVTRLAEALAERDVRVALAGFDEPASHFQFYRLGRPGVRGDWRYALAVPPLVRAIRRFRPDVVHAHYITSYGVASALATILAGLAGRRPALVQTCWGTDILVTPAKSSIARILSRFALRTANLITADSHDVLEQAEAMSAHRIPSCRFVFGPPARLFEYRRSEEGIVFVSARNLTHTMRIGRIIGAFITARASRAPLEWAELVVAGAGAAEAELRDKYEGSVGVRFVGHLEPGELHRLLAGATAYISIPETDGTSATLLEAMAIGTAPIVNDLPANREWVRGEIGIIVSADPAPLELIDAFAAAAERRSAQSEVRLAARPAAWEGEVDRLVERYVAQIPTR